MSQPPGLKRISVKFGYTTDGGGRFSWDAASHRKVPNAAGDGLVTKQKCEPSKVVVDTVAELARIAAIMGIPLAELRTTVSETYKAVEEWQKANK